MSRKAPRQTENVTTLFISGFPEDVAPREMLNFCRLCRGFEFAVAHSKNLFVKFYSVREAQQALDQIQGLLFDETDPQNDTGMRASFAKRDTDRPEGMDGREREREDERRATDRRDEGKQQRNTGRPSRGMRERDEQQRERKRELSLEPGPRQHGRKWEPRQPSLPPPWKQSDESMEGPRPSKTRRLPPPPRPERPRSPVNVDTLICKLGDHADDDVISYLGELSGCVKAVAQKKVVFAKFESAEMLQDAMETARGDGFVVDVAHRNMNA